MKFINLTHRNIVICDEQEREVLVLKPSGTVVGVTTQVDVKERLNWAQADQLDVVSYTYRDVTGLPDPKADVWLVVGYSVLQALNNSREDVISPDTSPESVVRKSGSQTVLGVKRFRKL